MQDNTAFPGTACYTVLALLSSVFGILFTPIQAAGTLDCLWILILFTMRTAHGSFGSLTMLSLRCEEPSVPSNMLTRAKSRHVRSIPGLVWRQSSLEYTLNTYRHLEGLFLRLASYDDGATAYPHIEILPALLEATTGLKRLSLRCSEDWEDGDDPGTLYSYGQIFPTARESEQSRIPQHGRCFRKGKEPVVFIND